MRTAFSTQHGALNGDSSFLNLFVQRKKELSYSMLTKGFPQSNMESVPCAFLYEPALFSLEAETTLLAQNLRSAQTRQFHLLFKEASFIVWLGRWKKRQCILLMAQTRRDELYACLLTNTQPFWLYPFPISLISSLIFFLS